MKPELIDTADRVTSAPDGIIGTTINIWWTADTPLAADEADGIILAMREAAEATYAAIKDTREEDLKNAASHAESVRAFDGALPVRRIVPGLED